MKKKVKETMKHLVCYLAGVAPVFAMGTALQMPKENPIGMYLIAGSAFWLLAILIIGLYKAETMK